MRLHLLVFSKKMKMLKTAFVVAESEVLSLVHTYATRHDTTACDTTAQRSKALRFFSLVPHIPRQDHASR